MSPPILSGNVLSGKRGLCRATRVCPTKTDLARQKERRREQLPDKDAGSLPDKTTSGVAGSSTPNEAQRTQALRLPPTLGKG